MKAVIQEMPTRWLEERRASDASRYDEMWDGVLHMAPAPDTDHQDLASGLLFHLKARWEPQTGGRVIYEVNVITPEDEANWTNNYRIPDIIMLSPDRLRFRKKKYIVGPPLVCIEFHSPGDESYEKLPFYAKLGVPEVWIIDRDTKKPEVFVLKGTDYESKTADSDGWIHSETVGVMMKAENQKLLVRFANETEAAVVPN
jgi:Uma2 family endonuclease